MCRWLQAQTEAICAREAAAAVAAGGGPVPWFAEIAAERDDLQRRALLLQEQKVFKPQPAML